MQILKKEMSIKGLSVKQLAQRIEMTPQALHSLIRGETKPRASTTKKLIDFGFSETAALNPAKEVEV